MKILLTGASGFIGSFIAEYFASKGSTIIAPTRNIKNSWRLPESGQIQLIEGDLLDSDFVDALCRDHNPEAVIHSAWGGSGRDQRESSTQVDNLIATQNLLEAASSAGCQTFIGIGTQAEYGIYNRRITEEFVPKPLSLYGAYKLSAGIIGTYYARKYAFRYAWLRLFSTFGPRDNEGYFIPHVIQSLLNGTAPALTSCKQKWDYLYVRDIPRLVEKVLENKTFFCDVYNLSSGNPISLESIVARIEKNVQSELRANLGALEQRPDGLVHLEGDNARFQQTFGWTDLTSLDEALKETVNWYRQERKGSAV